MLQKLHWMLECFRWDTWLSVPRLYLWWAGIFTKKKFQCKILASRPKVWLHPVLELSHDAYKQVWILQLFALIKPRQNKYFHQYKKKSVSEASFHIFPERASFLHILFYTFEVTVYTFVPNVMLVTSPDVTSWLRFWTCTRVTSLSHGNLKGSRGKEI